MFTGAEVQPLPGTATGFQNLSLGRFGVRGNPSPAITRARSLNAQTLDQFPPDPALLLPIVANAKNIVFFTSPRLLAGGRPVSSGSGFLTGRELRFVLQRPSLLKNTRFVVGG